MTYTAKLSNGNSLPNFISFDSSTRTFSISSSSITDTGTYTILISAYLTLNTAMTSTSALTWTLIVKSSTTTQTPYFYTSLTDQSLKAGSFLIYSLPTVVSPNGYSYTITLDGGSASSFV